jgi:tripartite-type tricarboxylate transporter receptor subunit TctC
VDSPEHPEEIMLNSTMRRSRRDLFALALLTGIAAAANLDAAQAQSWPTRPVTLVVPYGPGASNDLFTRALAERLTKQLGQPFIVENRAGAGGFTGTNAVSKAAPDGYTFLEIPNGIAGYKPVMKVNFDPEKDLTPIGLLARSPTAMVVPSSLPVKSVQEFIAYAKANPDKTFYGYTGVGTTQHQHGELFNYRTGLKIKGVNYKSSAEGQTDLVAGRLQLMFVTVASTLGQIQSGQLRLLAYTADNSPADAPKAPTMAEAGVKGMENAQIWWGLFAPPGLPADIQKKMNAAVNEALKDPAFAALMAKSGATPSPVTPEQFGQVVKKEVEDLLEIIKIANIKIE